MRKSSPSEPITKPWPPKSRHMNGGYPVAPADPIDRMEAARTELKSYTDDDPEYTGQFDVSKEGARVKGPPWLILGVGVLMLAAFVAWLYLRR